VTNASDEFEIMISRTHKLLEGDDATVDWNERIPDPDNPKQGRQIDVLVRKDGQATPCPTASSMRVKCTIQARH